MTPAEIRAAAEEDLPSVIELTQQLVRIPTRGGIDPYDDAIDTVASWARAHDLETRVLRGADDEPLAVVCDVAGGRPGPRYVLDACLDTAPFGDITAWTHDPTSGLIEDGWLHGRGSADSKVAVAIFLHIAARLRAQAADLAGTLTLLFDVDEHTGNFGGAKRYFAGPDAPTNIAGVMIGYPGPDRIVIGGRGFLRADITVRGIAGHTGSERTGSVNAIEKAGQFVAALASHQRPDEVDELLALPPKVSVTKIGGGESYSIIPDHCTLGVDIRLTTQFTRVHGEKLLVDLAALLDGSWPATPPTTLTFHESWPAYALDSSAPVKNALQAAIEAHLGHVLPAQAAGPSNIGNYLAGLGLESTAGFGVGYNGLHGTNERIEIETISLTQAAYHLAVSCLGRLR